MTLNYDQRHPQGDYETDHKNRDAENGAHEKDAYGPGPADPYTTRAHDGKPVVAGDEMRIAGECTRIVLSQRADD